MGGTLRWAHIEWLRRLLQCTRDRQPSCISAVLTVGLTQGTSPARKIHQSSKPISEHVSAPLWGQAKIQDGMISVAVFPLLRFVVTHMLSMIFMV